MILKFCFMFCILSQTVATQNVRKYDMQEEAFKLYKYDFKSVLRRFRRSGDYLKILDVKLVEMRKTTKRLYLQVLNHFHGKMESNVMSILTESRGKHDDEKGKRYFRTDDKHNPRPFHVSKADWKKILALDNYKKLNSLLTVSERNKLKELGFSFAGQVIHKIIENLKPAVNDSTEEKEDKEWTGAYDEKYETTTCETKHPKNHEITYWKYAYDDRATNGKIKPLNHTAVTPRFRAFEAPAFRNRLSMMKLKSPPTERAYVRSTSVE